MNIEKLYGSPHIRATIPYRMIGDIINDAKKTPHMWKSYKDAIINLCDLVVAYSCNKDDCERALNYLEKCIPIDTPDEFIEWGKPFCEFVKEFMKRDYDNLEAFCEEASDKLFKEE